MTLTAVLTAQGHLDPQQEEGSALRKRLGLPDKQSLLVLDEGEWVLRGLHGDNDPIWTIDTDILRPGEPVFLRRPDGEELIYRVVASEAL